MRAPGAAYSHIVPAFLRVVIVVAALLRMNSVAARRQHRRTRQDGASAIRDPTGRTVNYSAGPDRTGVVRADRTPKFCGQSIDKYLTLWYNISIMGEVRLAYIKTISPGVGIPGVGTVGKVR